jgi:hypothetical protein
MRAEKSGKLEHRGEKSGVFQRALGALLSCSCPRDSELQQIRLQLGVVFDLGQARAVSSPVKTLAQVFAHDEDPLEAGTPSYPTTINGPFAFEMVAEATNEIRAMGRSYDDRCSMPLL